jgi:SAM-dependent methyltransferase
LGAVAGSKGSPGGGVQTWNPERYARTAGFVPEFGVAVLGLLAPMAGENILDLGCGDGSLSERIIASGASAVGVDASPEQVAAAKSRGVDARVCEGQSLDFDADFDAVFSNAALHWMRPPGRVAAGVWRALKPGGRFVGEMGGKGNIEAVVGALTECLERRGIDARALSPWYFPGVDDYTALLQGAGFRVIHMELFPRPTQIPGVIEDWLWTFCEVFLNAVPDGGRPAFMAELEEALAPELLDDRGRWSVDYVRLRFHAVRD